MQESSRHHRSPGYEEMRLRFNNILDSLMPEEGDAILLLGQHGARDPEVLRDALVVVVNEDLDDHGRFQPYHAVILTALPGAPGVIVAHLLDDYWWIEIYPSRDAPTGAREVVTAAEPAISVLRVEESRDNLPVDYDLSPRLTPLTPQTTAAQRARVIEDFLRAP